MTDRQPSPPNAFEVNKPRTKARALAEDAIERIREKGGIFVNAVRATRMPMAVTDPTLPGNPIVFANAAFLELCGYAMEEVLGQQPFFLNGSDTDPEDAARFRKALEEDRDEVVESVQYRKNGSRFVAAILISAFKGDDGRTANQFLSYLDITRRNAAEAGLVALRKMQRRLHESKTRLASIVEHAKVGISELSVDGRFLEANPELCRILGRSRAEVLRLSITDVTHPDDIPASVAALGRVLKGHESAELDKRYRHPDGTVVCAQSQIARLLHGPEQPATLLVVTVDLTARREAERALRQSEERHRMILESARDYAIFTTDTNGIIDTWPPGAEAVFGWTSDDIVGQPFSMTFLPEDRLEGIPERELAEAATAGVAADIRWHLCKNGSKVFIEGWTRTLWDGEPAPHGFLKIGQDVTRRHEWEETQKVLVAELQHRTRNLIAVVRSIAAQTMARTGPTEAFRIEFNDRLSALSRVQGLLSRAGDERVAIGELVRMELDSLGAAAGDKVSVEGPAVPLRTSVVQTLSLALHELATNARKYGALSSPAGRLSISWATRHVKGDGERLVLEWREEGYSVRTPETGNARRGYGRELIEKALPYSLGARTLFELGPHGLHCTIDIPLAKGDPPR